MAIDHKAGGTSDATSRRVDPNVDYGPLQPGQAYPGGPILTAAVTAPVAPSAPEPAKLYGTTVTDPQGNKYITVNDPAKPGAPEFYKEGVDGKVTKVTVTDVGINRNDGKGVMKVDGVDVQIQQQNGQLDANAVGKLRTQAGVAPQASVSPPAPPPPPPEAARPILYGTAVQDAQGNKYVTVNDPLKPGMPEFYKMGKDGKATKVDITEVGINRDNGQGVIKVNGADVQVTQLNGRIGPNDINKLREQAAAAGAPAPTTAAPLPTPSPAPAVVAPGAPAAPAAAAPAAINFTAQQRDAYLRVAGFDGKDREAALNAFAAKNNLLGADGKPDMQKVNQALQAKVQGTPEAQAYIERVLKDAKATKEEKQTAQWTMVANGAKMPISTKPDGTMDGIIGNETKTQGATVTADLKAGRVQRYAIPAIVAPVVAAPAPTSAPVPAAAPAPAVTAAPAPVVAGGTQAGPPRPPETSAPIIYGAIPQRPAPGANDIRLGSPEAYRLAMMQLEMRQNGRQPFVSPTMPALGTPSFNGNRPGYYPYQVGTPGFNPNAGINTGVPIDPRVAGTVDTVVRQGERELLSRMTGRGGVLGALGEAGATMAEGAFTAGRYDRETARMQAAAAAAAPNIRGSFGAAAMDPTYLARVADARASVSDHLRQRSTDAAVEGLAGRALGGIYTPQGNNGVVGDFLGRILKH